MHAAALALALMLVAGCTSSHGKATDTIATTTAPSPASLPPVLSTVPTESARTKSYIVISGDSLSAIAAAASTSLGELVAANSWSDGAAHVIHPGDVIELPAGATQPEPRSTSTTTNDSPVRNSSTSVTGGAALGGYRLLGPEEEPLPLGADGTSHPVSDPLADGLYFADTYGLTADGAGVRFNIARFMSTEACIATLDTVTDGTIDPSGCYGGHVDTSSTAVVTRGIDSNFPVVLVFDDRGSVSYLEVTSEEFARLLKGELPASDAPAGYEFRRWPAMVEVVDGTVQRLNQRWSS